MSGWEHPDALFARQQARHEAAERVRTADRLAAARRRVEVAGRAGPREPALLGERRAVPTGNGKAGHHPALYVAPGGSYGALRWRWTCSCGGDSRRGFLLQSGAQDSAQRHVKVMTERAASRT